MLCKTNSEIVSIIYIRYQNEVEYLFKLQITPERTFLSSLLRSH